LHLGRGTNLCEFKIKDQRAASRMAFSPNGRWLATFNGADSLQMWDTSVQREVSAWPRSIRKIRALCFSPDSRWLACGDESGKITLWEVETAKLLFKLPGHNFGMNRLAFSPDGLRLASAGWDSRARLWDLRARKQVAEFFGCRSSFFRVVFSPDGSRLLLSEWGDTFLFDIQAERQVARLKSFMPVFLDADTVLGLNVNGIEHYRAPRLEEIDAAFMKEGEASGKASGR
jgi:WD40 repeat protein